METVKIPKGDVEKFLDQTDIDTLIGACALKLDSDEVSYRIDEQGSRTIRDMAHNNGVPYPEKFPYQMILYLYLMKKTDKESRLDAIQKLRKALMTHLAMVGDFIHLKSLLEYIYEEMIHYGENIPNEYALYIAMINAVSPYPEDHWIRKKIIQEFIDFKKSENNLFKNTFNPFDNPPQRYRNARGGLSIRYSELSDKQKDTILFFERLAEEFLIAQKPQVVVAILEAMHMYFCHRREDRNSPIPYHTLYQVAKTINTQIAQKVGRKAIRNEITKYLVDNKRWEDLKFLLSIGGIDKTLMTDYSDNQKESFRTLLEILINPEAANLNGEAADYRKAEYYGKQTLVHTLISEGKIAAAYGSLSATEYAENRLLMLLLKAAYRRLYSEETTPLAEQSNPQLRLVALTSP